MTKELHGDSVRPTLKMPGVEVRSGLRRIGNQMIPQPMPHRPEFAEEVIPKVYSTVATVANLCRSKQDLPVLASCCASAAKSTVKEAAIEEYRPKILHHLKTISLMCLTGLASMISIIWLREVLVPLVLAIFFMLQLEPVLFFLMNPARACRPCCKPAARWADRVDQERVYFFGTGTESEEAKKYRRCEDRSKLYWAFNRCRSIHWKVRALVSVLTCIFLLFLMIATCGYLIFKSVTDFEWRKYADSPKTKRILRQMKKIGADPDKIEEVSDEVDYSGLSTWLMDGPLMTLFSYTLSFFGTMFLMCLFLAFLLLNDLATDSASHHVFGIQRKARLTVRRYMRIKTLVSIAVALLVWMIYEMLEVDLAFLFGFCAFLLNFIPHIGYTISAMLPLPLVFLDPDKTWGDFAACIIWPMAVHQVFSNIIEPRLLAKSLDLHPIVVLGALGFWTVCWGAVGAILSTPLTSVVRLILMEFDHPYAVVAVGLLEGQWGPSSERKRALGPTKVDKTIPSASSTWCRAHLSKAIRKPVAQKRASRGDAYQKKSG